MIKAIIFDNVGVFTKKGLGKTLDTVSEKFGFDRSLLEPAYKDLVKRANVGEITAMDMYQQLIDQFGVDAKPIDLKNVWIACYGEFPNPEMYEYARELGKEFKICMLTNYSDTFDDLNKQLKLETVFEPEMIFVSSKIGLKKPAAEAFRYVLDKLGTKPEETVFVDDREINFAEAQEMGIRGIVFKDIDQFRNDFEALIAKENR